MRPLLFSAFLLSSLLISPSSGKWCYESQDPCRNNCTGPKIWHQIEEHSECAMKRQSPINIVTNQAKPSSNLKTFDFEDYDETFNTFIRNNGHSVKVNLSSTITISSGNLTGRYRAVEFHLHWGSDTSPGSEHTIDGEQYPMELHIVHIKETYKNVHEAMKDKSGIAVLGFFYEESSTENPNYNLITEALSKINKSGESVALHGLTLDKLIPAKENRTKYYRYEGSLTTPSCAEAVVWTVFENRIPLSKRQLSAFHNISFSDGRPMTENFRPVQPRNGRVVYVSGSSIIFGSAVLLFTSVLTSVGTSWLH
ncbi:carbonic anhydrase 4a [Lepisosteus oculatus]|uniref:Carbonic anhydrase n=1 Tax=Lepisosteus oculatus TaxID=7918 RepID=W5M5J7_LEPOC|nr:PREDICTED: carbonic anhydrase 4-like [Lepisosteus oculatus]